MPSPTPPNSRRVDMFRMSPLTPKIPGVDIKIADDDPLWRPKHRLANLRDDSLVDSIHEIGVASPVPLIKRGDDYLVVFGCRRTFNARLAIKRDGAHPGALEMRVFLVNEMKPKELALWIQAENGQRLDDTLMDKAEGARRLIETFGATVAEAASSCHVTPTAVRQWLTALKSEPEVRAAVAAGTISDTVAVKLAKLPPEAQREQLAGMLASRAKPTAGRAAAAVRTAKKRAAKPDAEAEREIGKRLIDKILKYNDDVKKLISDDGLDMLRWLRNQRTDGQIKGMIATLRAIEGGDTE